jgi:molybdenum cofactor synthesis domain-containing protein
VVVISDSIATGKKSDRSGQLIVERLEAENLTVKNYQVVSDDAGAIRNAIHSLADQHINLILTTGGTGVSPRDNTPDVIRPMLDKELPGVAEAMRDYGQSRTPYAMLSRSVAGLIGETLVITLPGSIGGVTDSLNALFPAVLHAYKMLWGHGHAEKQNRDKVNA